MATTTTINSGIHPRLRTFILESPPPVGLSDRSLVISAWRTPTPHQPSPSAARSLSVSIAGRLTNVKLAQKPTNGNSMSPLVLASSEHGRFDAANDGRTARSSKPAGGREGARGHHGRTGTSGLPRADRRGSRQSRKRQPHHHLSAMAVQGRAAVGRPRARA